MEDLLERFGQAETDELPLWGELIECLRPRRPSDETAAREKLGRLCAVLAARPELRERLASALARLFRERKQVSLYATSGLLPSTGFFSEAARRIAGRLLPEALDTEYMKDVVAVLFSRLDDEVWVNAIPDESWIELFCLLIPEDAAPEEPPHPVDETLEALRVLSYHIAAISLDPEFVRIDPDLEEHESAFLAQNAELLAYIQRYKTWWRGDAAVFEDEKHLSVLLDQCEDVLQRIRRRATKIGTSLSLTFKVERLRQHLQRMHSLITLLETMRTRRSAADALPRMVALFKELITAECRKNHLRDHLATNVELLSLRMTESASRTGERYITTSRREYFGMMGSAALGGVIIAIMAAFKLMLGEQGFAPLTEALAFCLNYGIGFVLIHILGGTVATKQPAMTANAIAATIGEGRGKTRDLANLVEIIVRTIRSQFAAILGNVSVAIPVAMAIAWFSMQVGEAPLVSAAKAPVLLDQISPLGGAAIFAGIAGVCLFLSGLIAGYYDNLAAYGRIPQRILQMRRPRRWLGEARMQSIASYVENNLGALAGNFFFGFLLGGVSGAGVLLGLPLDIRHIAFSSANAGFAAAGLEFQLTGPLIALTATGVALIGMANLAVSFSLTLYVAMRARRISFAQGRSLLRLLTLRFLAAPRDFLIPPREDSQLEPTAPESGSIPSEPPEKRSSGR